MRILIFHGYLLRGTGSNVYNANLARALVSLGHEVDLLCQDRHAQGLDFVDGERCRVHLPDIGDVLPVYVADRYEGFQARPYPDLSEEEVERYIERNVAAVRQVAEATPPDVALANHLVMGPVILARALGEQGAPYAVTIHGSALEYTVKPHPERFMPYAREGLGLARTVLVGSRHTAESLWAAMDDPDLPARTRLGPPGVDVHEFVPEEPEAARRRLAGLRSSIEAARDAGGAAADDSVFARDLEAMAAALARLEDAEPLVAFVGKLIVSKGIDLMLAAWPLVLARVPDATLAVVGFGAFREGAERLVADLAGGDLAAVRELAEAGRAAEGGPRSRLDYLHAFLDRLEDLGSLRAAYLEATTHLPERVVFCGRLEHSEVAQVLPSAEALVFPSTFPEAFGMVAAEAAACGALPVSAAHSGLAEVTATLAADVPEPARPLLSFELGPEAVEQLAARVTEWLEAPAELRSATREGLVRAVRENYSWEGVAKGVIAAAQGRWDALAPVPGPDLRAGALG